jgi:hypothetical protein
MGKLLTVLILTTLIEGGPKTMIQDEVKGQDQVIRMMETAVRSRHAGKARKTRPVDARPAKPGEVVVTVILGEGEETRSKPAEAGDWVVRNRCPQTGNEQYLVKADRFAERYGEPQSAPDGEGWRQFTPQVDPVRYFLVSQATGEFSFVAPWGETMVARPGDAIVQDLDNPTDIYRVAAGSFACTYEVLEPARPTK